MALVGVVGVLIGAGLLQYAEAHRSKARLEEALSVRNAEAQRTDLSGGLTIFSTSYGREAEEWKGRGRFTRLLERYLFSEYVSVSHATALTQRRLASGSQTGQRAEILSSMNAEVFLNPRNPKRRFSSLIVGSDRYDNEPWKSFPLTGAVADARSIHDGLVKAGYGSTFLADPSRVELDTALHHLLSEVGEDCSPEQRNPAESDVLSRGVRVMDRLSTIKPCSNVLVFLYLSGHGFVRDGNTYIVLRDAKSPETRVSESSLLLLSR